MPTVSGFLPSTSGWRFSNAFAPRSLFDVGLGSAKIPIGNAANGLCGGMVFATRDYFEAGLVPPPEATPPTQGALYTYFVRRLFDSFNLPFGPARYLYLMDPALSDYETRPNPSRLARRSRAWVMIRKEWPKIRRDLDQGRLCSIGLVRVKCPLFKIKAALGIIGQNHQVLAYGYELNGNDLSLYIYDPNYPGNDNIRLSLSIANPYRATPVTYPPPSPVYCFFRTGYRFSHPPVL